MDESKNKEILNQLLMDMEDFAKLKNIDYPPIYLLGGSGCILSGYLTRATTDIDILDMDYDARAGRLLRILDRYDMLDIYLTTIPMDFEKRVLRLDGFKNLFVLSREDIILSKLGRYSPIDIEDISKLIGHSDKKLVGALIQSVITRKNISTRVKNVFMENVKNFKERFDV